MTIATITRTYKLNMDSPLYEDGKSDDEKLAEWLAVARIDPDTAFHCLEQCGVDGVIDDNAAAVVDVAPVCVIFKNSAGQISQQGMDGDYFNMSKYVGATLYVRRGDIKGEPR